MTPLQGELPLMEGIRCLEFRALGSQGFRVFSLGCAGAKGFGFWLWVILLTWWMFFRD